MNTVDKICQKKTKLKIFVRENISFEKCLGKKCLTSSKLSLIVMPTIVFQQCMTMLPSDAI